MTESTVTSMPEPYKGTIEVLDINVEQDIQDCIDEFKAAGASEVNLVKRNQVTKSAVLMVTAPEGRDEFRKKLAEMGGGIF